MAKIQHTPGPWDIEGSEQEGWTVRSTVDIGPTTIATVRGWLPEYADEERANAHLIAAAPDLLKVLEGIVKKWGYPNTEEWHEAVAAIAKAKGRKLKNKAA